MPSLRRNINHLAIVSSNTSPAAMPPMFKTKVNPNTRYYNSFDLISLGHAFFVLLFGTIAVLFEMPRLASLNYDWEQWFAAPTSRFQNIIFCISALYYTYDMLVILLTRAHLTRRDLGLVMHHFVAFAGMLGPLITGKDGIIIMCGYLIAETSNPPRLMSQICYRSRSKNCFLRLQCFRCLQDGQREKTAEWLRITHLATFLVSRLALAHYMAHAVLPCASLYLTKLCCSLALSFSVFALGEYITTHNGLFDGTSSGILL